MATIATARPIQTEAAIADDRRWLAVMAGATTVELGWWATCWIAGSAPPPHLLTCIGLAAAALAGAVMLRLFLARPERCSNATLVAGALLVGVGASVFLPLKLAIPSEVPFWLDGPLASAEKAVFGAHPWLLLDHLLGWALRPIDRVYGLWLPLQSIVVLAIILEPPSAAKSRALIAYSLAWLLLGVLAAALLSSAGPLFYDRLFGGDEFAGLREVLVGRGAAEALSASDAMWQSLSAANPGLIAGVSAMPSMHVAISFWMYLAARTMAPRIAPFVLAYAAFIWIASVQLGWHYVSDGLVGILGMLGVWALAGRIDAALARPEPAGSSVGRSFVPGWYRDRYLDVLGSVYIYNEHRGYTAIDRMLDAVRARWPHDHHLIAQVEKHRADEYKHYLMFRRWFEHRGTMPLDVDRTFGHIDRFVGIMFRSTIDALEPLAIIDRPQLFERLCRVVSLTEKRGYRQVDILLRHRIVRTDARLMKIFHIIEQDEPSHWAPYDGWLAAHQCRQASRWERAIDSFIHSELLVLKLPILFFNFRMPRRSSWPDEAAEGRGLAGQATTAA